MVEGKILMAARRINQIRLWRRLWLTELSREKPKAVTNS
jgi:hypothetical protein